MAVTSDAVAELGIPPQRIRWPEVVDGDDSTYTDVEAWLTAHGYQASRTPGRPYCWVLQPNQGKPRCLLPPPAGTLGRWRPSGLPGHGRAATPPRRWVAKIPKGDRSMVMLRQGDLDVSAATLAANRLRVLDELRPLLNLFEVRYELSSERLMEALASGALPDTEEVCDWVIAWETYRALRDGGPSRLE